METKKMGVDQFAELVAGFVRNFPRDLSPEAAQYWIEHPDELKAMLGTVPGKKPEGKKAIDDIFIVTVDYALSLAAMIAAGKYDWANEDIAQRNFPLRGEGKVEVGLRLVHLDREMSTEAVLAELDQRGLRPATLAELLAFGAKYPEEQRKYPIVALGSVWACPRGGRFVPCLYRDGSERDLRLRYDDDVWRESYRFLAASK